MDAASIDEFVNGNKANIELDARGFDAIEQEFLNGLAVETDDSNDDAFPVIVYTRNGEPVAWVDLEVGVGYAG